MGNVAYMSLFNANHHQILRGCVVIHHEGNLAAVDSWEKR